MQVTVDGHVVTLTDAEVVVAEQIVTVVDHVGRVLVAGLGGCGPRYTADTSRNLAVAAGRLADLLGNGRSRPPLRWPVIREAAATWSRFYRAGRLLLPPGGATRQGGGG